MSAASASTAAVSSGPDARNVIDDPHSAASMSTPMMLLPFTSRSSRTITMSLANFAAVFTISAAGRAWRPFLFTMVTVRSAMSDHRREEDERGQDAERDAPALGAAVHADQFTLPIAVASTTPATGNRPTAPDR